MDVLMNLSVVIFYAIYIYQLIILNILNRYNFICKLSLKKSLGKKETYRTDGGLEIQKVCSDNPTAKGLT